MSRHSHSRSRLPCLTGRRELHAWIPVTPAVRGTRQIRSAPAMRCALAPSLAASQRPRPHTPCSLPFAGEAAAIDEPRDASAAAHSPPLPRASPPCAPHFMLARRRLCAAQIQNNVGEGSTAASCVLGLKLRTLRVGAALLSPPSSRFPPQRRSQSREKQHWWPGTRCAAIRAGD